MEKSSRVSLGKVYLEKGTWQFNLHKTGYEGPRFYVLTQMLWKESSLLGCDNILLSEQDCNMFKMLRATHQMTQHHIPEDKTLQIVRLPILIAVFQNQIQSLGQ
jgi:hypothetical protein